MRLGTLRSCFMFCSVLIFTSPAQAQRKAPPDPARPKIRAITAFINLDRAQYQQQVADAMTMPGEKLEDVFKSVRRQVRLSTGEQQIPWESTSLELDFYFVPPVPPPSPAAQLLTAANETGNLALFDLLIERFPDSTEATFENREGTCSGSPGWGGGVAAASP